MATTPRPTLYDEVPARYRLSRTFRNRDSLPTVPDSTETAKAIRRRVRDFGTSPMEALRRTLDAEAQRAAATLTPAGR